MRNIPLVTIRYKNYGLEGDKIDSMHLALAPENELLQLKRKKKTSNEKRERRETKKLLQKLHFLQDFIEL